MADVAKAAKNFESLGLIIKALKDLENDESLLIQCGKPFAILKTHQCKQDFNFQLSTGYQITFIDFIRTGFPECFYFFIVPGRKK